MNILSTRNFLKHPSWDIVHEWEDEIALYFKIKILKPRINTYRLRILLNKISNKIGLPLFKGNLVFEMNARELLKPKYNRNDIVIVIDYFLSDEESKKFIDNCYNYANVLITSKEAYDQLIKLGADPMIFKHWPISIPSKYVLSGDSSYVKKYDIVLLGRIPDSFINYLEKYKLDHNISIISRKIENGHYNYYTKDGEYVGNADNRDGYIKLMQQSRCILYSTPGFEDTGRSGVYSQVTPRFLEAIACECNLVLRYKDNSDSKYFELNKFGQSIQTYDDFKNALYNALTENVDIHFYSEYLKGHYTSVRCMKLNELLKL